MMYSPSEKLEINRIVEDSELSTRQTLKELGIHRSIFYNWYYRYLEDGVEGFGSKKLKASVYLLFAQLSLPAQHERAPSHAIIIPYI
jgi:transposase-like protein